MASLNSGTTTISISINVPTNAITLDLNISLNHNSQVSHNTIEKEVSSAPQGSHLRDSGQRTMCVPLAALPADKADDSITESETEPETEMQSIVAAPPGENIEDANKPEDSVTESESEPDSAKNDAKVKRGVFLVKPRNETVPSTDSDEEGLLAESQNEQINSNRGIKRKLECDYTSVPRSRKNPFTEFDNA